MSNSSNNSQSLNKNKSAQEMASDIFNGTKVESAYDVNGQFSHLLAKLPPAEFMRLYAPGTTASIFIQGNWLQLCLQQSRKKIVNKTSRCEITLEIGVNEFGVTEVSFYRFSRRISKVKFKTLKAQELLTTEIGYHRLARAAVRAFANFMPQNPAQKLLAQKLPVVVVVMEKEQKADNNQFDSSLVSLH